MPEALHVYDLQTPVQTTLFADKADNLRIGMDFERRHLRVDLELGYLDGEGNFIHVFSRACNVRDVPEELGPDGEVITPADPEFTQIMGRHDFDPDKTNEQVLVDLFFMLMNAKGVI